MKIGQPQSNDGNKNLRKRILFLDSMRAIAIIMVVGIHTLSYCLPLPTTQKDIIALIVEPIPVALFFLVDGYLFALHISSAKKYNYFDYIRKSAIRLLVPWVIFTLIYLAARYYFEMEGYLTEKLIIGQSPSNIALYSYGSVYFAQMYFLVSLFIVRLFTPIFRRIILFDSHFKSFLIFICFLMAYEFSAGFIDSMLSIKGGEEPITHAIWGVQFYLLGIILYKLPSLINIQKLLIPFISIFAGILFFHKYVFALDYGKLVNQYVYLLVVFFLFSCIGDKFSRLEVIGKNTMGIYLIHAPIIIKLVSLVTNKLIVIPIYNYLVIFVATLLLSMLSVFVIKKIPYGPIMFGEIKKS